jgi:hypothetical protein
MHGVQRRGVGEFTREFLNAVRELISVSGAFSITVAG